MNEQTFKSLNLGDMVKHVSKADIFVVTGNYGDRITAVTSVDLTNPNEWELVKSPNKPVEPTARAECAWCKNDMTDKSYCERCGF